MSRKFNLYDDSGFYSSMPKKVPPPLPILSQSKTEPYKNPPPDPKKPPPPPTRPTLNQQPDNPPPPPSLLQENLTVHRLLNLLINICFIYVV